jgi:hypothetical protein
MMSSRKLVAVNHVGGVEQVLSEPNTIRFIFHDFVDLIPIPIFTESPAAPCHGYEWKVKLYPFGGLGHNNSMVCLDLACVSPKRGEWEVKAKYTLRVKKESSELVLGDGLCVRKIQGSAPSTPRVDVLDPSKGYLVDGNLTIEVDIQVYIEKLPAFRPKTTLDRDMTKLLESAQYSDVEFQVGTEKFSAHRCILAVRAPDLAALANDCTPDTPIHIQDIKPSAFRSLLCFVYGNAVPEFKEMKNEARELIDVADRYGCISLKLLVEAELVESGMTVDTAADLIILGDAKNCALLKEAAVEFFAENAESVKSSTGWKNIEESFPLMKELMYVVLSGKGSAPADSDELDYKRMRVSTLRATLEEKGLDVDGSREMLIRRLEEGENDK